MKKNKRHRAEVAKPPIIKAEPYWGASVTDVTEWFTWLHSFEKRYEVALFFHFVDKG